MEDDINKILPKEFRSPLPPEWEALRKQLPVFSIEQVHRLQDEIERQRQLDKLLEAIVYNFVVTGLEGDSIRKLGKLIRHGAKTIDVHVRKDGQEYHFEADWLKQLFNPYKTHI